jgi:hypothetical protein
LVEIGSYSGFNRFICKKDTGGWVQFYLSIKAITALIASILLTSVLGSVKSLKLPAVEAKYIFLSSSIS